MPATVKRLPIAEYRGLMDALGDVVRSAQSAATEVERRNELKRVADALGELNSLPIPGRLNPHDVAKRKAVIDHATRLLGQSTETQYRVSWVEGTKNCSMAGDEVSAHVLYRILRQRAGEYGIGLNIEIVK